MPVRKVDEWVRIANLQPGGRSLDYP